jgi:hypothetical protein
MSAVAVAASSLATAGALERKSGKEAAAKTLACTLTDRYSATTVERKASHAGGEAGRPGQPRHTMRNAPWPLDHRLPGHGIRDKWHVRGGAASLLSPLSSLLYPLCCLYALCCMVCLVVCLSGGM